MAVSKRLRYEILRRDNFACRYCGEAAPDVKITVDHVTPVALGGTDDPTNLVAACKDCNAGKSSSHPDQPLVDDVNADALRWGRAMQIAAERRVADRRALDGVVAHFDEVWAKWSITRRDGTELLVPRDDDWPASIRRFAEAGIEIGTMAALVRDAMECKVVKSQHTWRSFCRRCWDEISARQELAKQLVNGTPVSDAHLWDPLVIAARSAWPWFTGTDAADLADESIFYFQRAMELWTGGTLGAPEDESLIVRTLAEHAEGAPVTADDSARTIGRALARHALESSGVSGAFLSAVLKAAV